MWAKDLNHSNQTLYDQDQIISSHIANNAIISIQPATPPGPVLLSNLNTFISNNLCMGFPYLRIIGLSSQQWILFINKQTGLIHNLQHKKPCIISLLFRTERLNWYWVNNTVINSQTNAPPKPLLLIFSCHPNSLIINEYATVSDGTRLYTWLCFIEPAYGKWNIENFTLSSLPAILPSVPVFSSHQMHCQKYI